MATVSRKDLAELVHANLVPIGVSLYDAETELLTTPPVIPGDSYGRVQPYVVELPGAGAPDDEEDLAATLIGVGWTFQLTCAAGRLGDLLQLVDAVTARFERWSPTIPGLSVGFCRQLNDPGPARPDKSVTPTRYVLPLQYVLHAGT